MSDHHPTCPRCGDICAPGCVICVECGSPLLCSKRFLAAIKRDPATVRRRRQRAVSRVRAGL